MKAEAEVVDFAERKRGKSKKPIQLPIVSGRRSVEIDVHKCFYRQGGKRAGQFLVFVFKDFPVLGANTVVVAGVEKEEAVEDLIKRENRVSPINFKIVYHTEMLRAIYELEDLMR